MFLFLASESRLTESIRRPKVDAMKSLLSTFSSINYKFFFTGEGKLRNFCKNK